MEKTRPLSSVFSLQQPVFFSPFCRMGIEPKAAGTLGKLYLVLHPIPQTVS